jgi:glycosidase
MPLWGPSRLIREIPVRGFLRKAHARGLRVITELIINHTADQHPWFQRARRARPSSHWRDFYVWSDTPEKYKLTSLAKDYAHTRTVSRACGWALYRGGLLHHERCTAQR